MSYRNQVIEWDVPESEVQVGVPVGYEVELSLTHNFDPVSYVLSTFDESTAAPQGVFFYSLDDGETWIDYPTGSSGKAFYDAYKMRVFVNVGYVNDFFVEKTGIVYRVLADGSDWSEAYDTKTSGFTDSSIDLNKDVLYLSGVDSVARKIETIPTMEAALRSVRLDDNPIGVEVDGSRGTLWVVQQEKAVLRTIEGQEILSIGLPEPIDVEVSSSSTSSSSSSTSSSSSSSSSTSSSSSSSSTSSSSSSSTSLSSSSSSSTSLTSSSSTSSEGYSTSSSSSSSSSSSEGYSTSSSSSSTSSTSSEGYSTSSSTSACEGVCDHWHFEEWVGASDATGDIYPDAELPPNMQRTSDCALRVRLYYTAIAKGPASPICPNMPANTRKIWVYTPDSGTVVAETICEAHNNPTADLWVAGSGFTVHWGSIINMTCGAIVLDFDSLTWADCTP